MEPREASEALTYVTKTWNNQAVGGTPLNNTGLNDLETRIAAGFAGVSAGSGFGVVIATGGDDTTTITTAINALAATGGTLLLPSSLYKITTVPLPIAPKTVTLIGGGIDATVIKQFNTTIGTGLVQMFDVPAGATFRLRDLTIDGTTALSGVGLIRLILQNAGSGGTLDCERVRFTKFSYGIWSEDQFQILRDCIFDGGSAGTGMGGIYTNGLLANYAGSGARCFMQNCTFTDCGVTGTGQHHSTYFYSGIQVIAHGNTYTRLWGDGYHCHHNDDRLIGVRTIGCESKYTDCYVGGGLGGGSINGFAVCKEIILTLKNVTVESVDIPFYLEQNSRLVMSCCVIGGLAGTAVFNWEDTGIEVWADDCTFNSAPGNYQFYVFNDSAKLTILNSRFTGACQYDVNILAGLTGGQYTFKNNVHSGATAGAYRFNSGSFATLQGNRFTGSYSDAAVRNNTASTLVAITIQHNDFSQASGTSVTNSTAIVPTKANNYGTVGYP